MIHTVPTQSNDLGNVYLNLPVFQSWCIYMFMRAFVNTAERVVLLELSHTSVGDLHQTADKNQRRKGKQFLSVLAI